MSAMDSLYIYIVIADLFLLYLIGMEVLIIITVSNIFLFAKNITAQFMNMTVRNHRRRTTKEEKPCSIFPITRMNNNKR